MNEQNKYNLIFLEKLINEKNNYSREITKIEKSDKGFIDLIKREITIYFKQYPSFGIETGRTWVLVGEKDNIKIVLTSGQSQDIQAEVLKLSKHAVGIYKGKKYKKYNDYYNEYDNLYFYEILIDEFLLEKMRLKKDYLVELAYELSKDYLAEYLVAKKTGALDWNSYGSGIGKRFKAYDEQVGIKNPDIKH